MGPGPLVNIYLIKILYRVYDCPVAAFGGGNWVALIEEPKHQSHFKDLRVGFFFFFIHFPTVCHIASFCHFHSRENPSLRDYRKELRANNETGASTHARGVSDAPWNHISTHPIAFGVGFLRRSDLSQLQQAEVPTPWKSVLSVHRQRHWPFEEYLYPIKLLLLYMEHYELMFPL